MRRPGRSRGPSRTKVYGLLRAIMNSAVDDELITISPVHIRGAGATAKGKVLEPATPADLNAIAANMPERLRAAVMISAWCALSYGELAELRRKGIDIEQKMIKVRRVVTFPPGSAVVGPPKSDAGVRDVEIPPHVWPIIEEHLNTHAKPTPNAMLFPGQGGGHIWHPGVRWHDLSHTARPSPHRPAQLHPNSRPGLGIPQPLRPSSTNTPRRTETAS